MSDNKRVNEDLLKKVEGHLDELKGKLLQTTGHQVKGGMQVLKGKMENADADADIALQDAKENIDHNVEKAKEKVRNDIKNAFS